MRARLPMLRKLRGRPGSEGLALETVALYITGHVDF